MAAETSQIQGCSLHRLTFCTKGNVTSAYVCWSQQNNTWVEDRSDPEFPRCACSEEQLGVPHQVMLVHASAVAVLTASALHDS